MGFWKNEWDLFKQDMKVVGDFLVQPVYFSEIDYSSKSLQPTMDEVKEKASQGGFWAKQWKMFENEFDNAMDFLMQPVKFK